MRLGELVLFHLSDLLARLSATNCSACPYAAPHLLEFAIDHARGRDRRPGGEN